MMNEQQLREWQAIAKPPVEGEIVLGFWSNGEMHTGSVWEGGWVPAWERALVLNSYDFAVQEHKNWSMPTHWMPLPAEPTIDKPEAKAGAQR
jgi:hypothetical protein